MMTHKGYIGVAKVDAEAGVIRGRVLNIRDVVTFQGRTVDEARQAFVDSVEDYLDFCASRGEPPEKPYSGKFLVRTRPAVHKALAIEASRRGQSLNAFVNALLTRAARRPPAEPAR
jgi:predicted HicB family RNase H-like nuclease